ncbi:MAG: CRISPR-associated endoribonuclease Cas6 [Bacteroidales bacterium]|nr:CRISPR-associated endoribonuclease Cas6 [Bacteroidales bacterium]
MRFKIELALENPVENLLPVNYQYEVSSWIYNTIHMGDKDIATWLHDHGYKLKDKSFRLFSFSNLNIPKWNLIYDRLQIQSPQVNLIVSFYPVKILEPFIMGVFKEQKCEIGDKKSKVSFLVKSIEKLPEPKFIQKMRYKCLSPMHIAWRNPESSEIKYLDPEHPEFENLLITNLVNKQQAFNQKQEITALPQDFKFNLISKPKRKAIKIKAGTREETTLIGYLFDFDFEAPPEYQKLGYYCGFGKANAMGFGCVGMVV